MRRVIHKYQFDHGYALLGDALLPEGAHVVLVGEQNDRPAIWALVDPSIEPSVKYRIFATGEPCPPMEDHVGSLISYPCVWHVFKGTP
jgi:hypothetical protein